MRYGQGYSQFQSISIKVKFYQISPCCYQNLHKHQQLNLVIDVYYKIWFGMVTLFFQTFWGENITKFCN